MSHHATASTSAAEKARTYLKDCLTILDGALTLYFDDTADIDSEHSNTPEAMRYLDGREYMTAVVCAVYNHVHDALTALKEEGAQHDGAANVVAV